MHFSLLNNLRIIITLFLSIANVKNILSTTHFIFFATDLHGGGGTPNLLLLQESASAGGKILE
jgi:hypothetical protein